MDNGSEKDGKRFSLCLASLLLATLAINLLSGYIRHHEAGLDCEPWPSCYGQVGHLIAPSDADASPIAVLTPTDNAKRAHRTIATILVILVALVVYQARARNLRGAVSYLPYSIVAVILLLSVVGPASYLKTLPAIATVNMAGGMTLLALVWLLWLGTRTPQTGSYPALKTWATAGLIVVVVQVLLGSWVSANFAAIACEGFLTCNEAGGEAGIQSFWYFRELTLTESGRIELGADQSLIQQTHHLGAVLTTGVLATLAILCSRAGGNAASWGHALQMLLVVQIMLGLSGLVMNLPALIVLTHNLVASLLLLTTLRILLLTR